MKFSIIVPAYNAEDSIADTLDSICSQTYNDYEIILVNDGSSDKTKSICEEFCNAHKNANFIEQVNKGVYEARRAGARKSTGEYLLFVDADDRLRTDTLDLLSSQIDRYSPDLICFCYTRHGDYSRDPFLSPALPAGLYAADSSIEIKKCFARGRLTSIWGKAIKRRCLEPDLGISSGQRVDFAEDLLQMSSVIEQAKSLLQMDDILYFYNVQNNQSATHNYKEQQLRDLTYVTSELLQKTASWDKSIKEEILRMRTAQYLYLLFINELTSSKETRKANFSSICHILFSLKDRAMAPKDSARPDSYLLYLAAKHENYAIARIVIRGSEFAKNLIRPTLSHLSHI